MMRAQWLWFCAVIATGCSASHSPAEGGGTGLHIENAGDSDETPASERVQAPEDEMVTAGEMVAPDEDEPRPDGDVIAEPTEQPPPDNVGLPPTESWLTESECPPDFSTDENNPIIPALPPMPAPNELPQACDEEAAIARAVDACGPVQRLDVQDSLEATIAQCEQGRFCHVVLPEGDFEYERVESEDGAPALRCTMIEGAGSELTRIETSGIRTSEHVVLARLLAHSSYGPISGESGPLLINEVELVGGYEGASFSWSAADGAAVCRSSVRGGYSGLSLSWESSNLLVAGSAIAACYEGVGISWESYGVQIVSNNIFGAYAAIGTSWGSHDILVQGNELASSGGDGWPGAAVNLHMPRSIDILDNVILSGLLPISDPGLDVVVEGNEIH